MKKFKITVWKKKYYSECCFSGYCITRSLIPSGPVKLKQTKATRELSSFKKDFCLVVTDLVCCLFWWLFFLSASFCAADFHAMTTRPTTCMAAVCNWIQAERHSLLLFIWAALQLYCYYRLMHFEQNFIMSRMYEMFSKSLWVVRVSLPYIMFYLWKCLCKVF